MNILPIAVERGPVTAIRPISPVLARHPRRVHNLAAPELTRVLKRRDEAAAALQASRSDDISSPAIRNKRVEAFLTKVLNSGSPSQVLVDKILRNFDKNGPLGTELSQETVIGALGSIATHAATANLPALFMSAFEILSKLAQATNHPIAEMAVERLYSLKRNAMWQSRVAAAELGINETATSQNTGIEEIAFAA